MSNRLNIGKTGVANFCARFVGSESCQHAFWQPNPLCTPTWLDFYSSFLWYFFLFPFQFQWRTPRSATRRSTNGRQRVWPLISSKLWRVSLYLLHVQLYDVRVSCILYLVSFALLCLCRCCQVWSRWSFVSCSLSSHDINIKLHLDMLGWFFTVVGFTITRWIVAATVNTLMGHSLFMI